MGCHVERATNFRYTDGRIKMFGEDILAKWNKDFGIHNYSGLCRLGVIRIIRELYNEHSFAPTITQVAIKLKISDEELKRACPKEWAKYCFIAGLPTTEGCNFKVSTI